MENHSTKNLREIIDTNHCKQKQMQYIFSVPNANSRTQFNFRMHRMMKHY